jgi:hypothetical protein
MEDYMKLCVKNMKQVVEDKDLAKWLVSFEPRDNEGFIWTQHKNINIISGGVANDGHSGASFALCLRQVKQELKDDKK